MANEINGLHLIVDGRVKDPSVFTQSALGDLLRQLIRDLEMVCIWGPEFKEVELEPEKLTGDKFQDEGGTSGFCMINKSHISIHVWPLRHTFMLDICSCDAFSREKAEETIRKVLQPSTMKVVAVWRRP